MAEEKPKTEDVEIATIATQTAKVFKLPDGNLVELEDYLVWLGNQIVAIKKAVIGK